MRNLCATVLTVLFAFTSAYPALVAHWDFSDDTYNDQVGSLHGTASGSISIVDSANSHFSKAIQLGTTAGTDYLNIEDLNTLGIYTNSFTLSLWIKHDALPVDGTDNPEFWDSYSGGSGAYDGVQAILRKGSDGSNANKAFITVGGAGTASTLLKGDIVGDGEWHWIVVWYDGGANELKYFEDGVHRSDRDATRISSLVIDTGATVRIGDGFGGQIGDVRIYDEALSFVTDSNNELKRGELYDLYAPTGLDTLVAHWNFSDGTYNDLVGDLDGTAYGSVSVADSGTPYFAKAVQTGSSKGTDYLNLGDLGTLGIYTNSFTVSLWIKHDALPVDGTDNPEFWDSYSGSSGAYDGIQAILRNGSDGSNANKAYITVGGAGTASTLLKGDIVGDGEWHWLTIRYDGDTDEMQYFEDGVHRADRDTTRIASLVQEAGRDLWLGDGFDGMIGDVRIYSSALSFTVDDSNILTGGDIYGIYTGSEEAATNFTGWVDMYPLLGTSTNYLDDPDADGLNNLLEYAFGGIPTDADAADIQPVSATDTNWLLYTYRRRLDAAARQLDYSVLSGTELSLDMMTNVTEEVGSTAIDSDFEVVTNRISMDAAKAFVVLKVQASE